MIKDLGKCYLYRHIRLDTNTPFYIGIGTKKDKEIDNNYYTRANSKNNRNNYWKHIVNKCGYKVEILLESDSYEFIKQKEIEFITLYGRKDLNKGILVNMDDGGNTKNNYICSIETRKKISNSKKGQIYTGKVNIIFKYSLNGDFIEEIKNINQFCIKNNYYDANLYKCALGQIKTCYGFIFKFKKYNNIEPQKIHKVKDKFKIDVYLYNDNYKLLGIFKNSELEDMGFLLSKVSACCLNKRNTHKNYVFSHKELSKQDILKKFNTTKTIIQMDLNGNFIKEWANTNKIKEELEIVKQLRNIYMCCNNKRNKAYGFKWKYKEN